MTDPVDALVASLKAVTSIEEFEDVLFPDRVFEGLRNNSETYDTVKGNLKMCWDDVRTHR